MTGHRRRLVLFPGALGDLLCCWPALEALRHSDQSVTLFGRPDWTSALPASSIRTLSIDRREIAEMFGSGPLSDAARESLGGYDRVDSFLGHGVLGFSDRLAAACGVPPRIHRLRGDRPSEHASTYFAHCLDVQPRAEALPVEAPARVWAASLWQEHRLGDHTLVVHPGSGSSRKNWLGAADVAQVWRRNGGSVVAIGGPAEGDRLREFPADLLVAGETLPRVAAVTERAHRFLGNDSGISHLAGLAGARGVAVFGSTDPAVWHPLGAGIRVVQGPKPCHRCGPTALCSHRVPVDDVLAALRLG